MEYLKDEVVEEMYRLACEVRENAYVPYSNFKVGAVILTENGNFHTGCNVENASYGLTICAERNAIFGMVKSGERKIKAIMVIGETDGPISPCGACRQVMSEFGNYPVYLTNMKKDMKITSVNELLPYNFTSDDLK